VGATLRPVVCHSDQAPRLQPSRQASLETRELGRFVDVLPHPLQRGLILADHQIATTFALTTITKVVLIEGVAAGAKRFHRQLVVFQVSTVEILVHGLRLIFHEYLFSVGILCFVQVYLLNILFGYFHS
jgi:hypothetical protein